MIFKKFFKPDFSDEENRYKYIEQYINGIKERMKSWVQNNKYHSIDNFEELFSLLLDIENDIRVLEAKADKSRIKEIATLYESLEKCLVKIYNNLLKLCSNMKDDYEAIAISVELNKLRGLIYQSITLPAIRYLAQEYGTSNFLKDGTDDLYDRLEKISFNIYMRNQDISMKEMKYR